MLSFCLGIWLYENKPENHSNIYILCKCKAKPSKCFQFTAKFKNYTKAFCKWRTKINFNIVWNATRLVSAYKLIDFQNILFSKKNGEEEINISTWFRFHKFTQFATSTWLRFSSVSPATVGSSASLTVGLSSWPLILMLCFSLNLLISMPFVVNWSCRCPINFSNCSFASFNWGSTSLTVRSHNTPPIKRKHLRPSSTVFSVSMTVLQ